MINVLVAWACARWAPGGHRPAEVTIGTTPVKTVPPAADKFLNDPGFTGRPKPFGPLITTVNPTPTPAPRSDFTFAPGAAEEQAVGMDMEERRSFACTRTEYTRWFEHRVLMGFSRTHAIVRFGLPFRSLEYAEQASYSSTGGSSVLRIPGWQSGWPIAPSARRQDDWTYLPPRHVYPLMPIPLGFAANSAIYAILVSTLLFAAQSLRRALRRKQGLCRKCAYPIGVSPVCTECGADISA